MTATTLYINAGSNHFSYLATDGGSESLQLSGGPGDVTSNTFDFLLLFNPAGNGAYLDFNQVCDTNYFGTMLLVQGSNGPAADAIRFNIQNPTTDEGVYGEILNEVDFDNVTGLDTASAAIRVGFSYSNVVNIATYPGTNMVWPSGTQPPYLVGTVKVVYANANCFEYGGSGFPCALWTRFYVHER